MQLRDIHQLRDAPAFSVSAIEGLSTVEGMLQEALRYVPYCIEHHDVWSSHFTTIILEAASQADSIWKATAKIDTPDSASDKLTLKDHFDRYGHLVSKQHVVFFGGPQPRIISPFTAWDGPFIAPGWWDAYNSLKHDRYSNQKEATLRDAINAVAALLLTLIYSGKCDLALMSAGLLRESSHNPWAHTETGLLRDVTFDCRCLLETKLFAHPLGVFGTAECNLSGYWDEGSLRYQVWWAQNSHQFTVQPKASQTGPENG